MMIVVEAVELMISMLMVRGGNCDEHEGNGDI